MADAAVRVIRQPDGFLRDVGEEPLPRRATAGSLPGSSSTLGAPRRRCSTGRLNERVRRFDGGVAFAPALLV
jgi:hypothetical protein